MKLNNFDKAKEYFNSSLDTFQKSKNPSKQKKKYFFQFQNIFFLKKIILKFHKSTIILAMFQYVKEKWH